MYVLGVDTGGTKSRCIVVDESNTLLGMGETGPGNYRVAGPDGARENVETAIRDALAAADVDTSEHLVGGFGMGTLDTEEDREIIEGFLDEIDFIDERYVTNDVIAAYYAVTAGGPGLVVIAGTGAMGFGRNEDGEQARSSGWGWLFGDEGGGYDAARRGLQAASKAHDGRDQQTTLVEAACEHFDLDSFEEVFNGVYDEIEHAKDIASFAKPVAEAAVEGDEVAIELVEESAAELASAAEAVVEKLDLVPAPTVACLGSYGRSEAVSPRFESNVRELYPEAEFADPVDNPAVGSVAFVAEERGEEISVADLHELDEAISTARE